MALMICLRRLLCSCDCWRWLLWPSFPELVRQGDCSAVGRGQHARRSLPVSVQAYRNGNFQHCSAPLFSDSWIFSTATCFYANFEPLVLGRYNLALTEPEEEPFCSWLETIQIYGCTTLPWVGSELRSRSPGRSDRFASVGTWRFMKKQKYVKFPAGASLWTQILCTYCTQALS